MHKLKETNTHGKRLNDSWRGTDFELAATSHKKVLSISVDGSLCNSCQKARRGAGMGGKKRERDYFNGKLFGAGTVFVLFMKHVTQ